MVSMDLRSFVARTAMAPIRWGRDDCALWCASAVLEATGYDPAQDLRGTYDSWMSCRRLVMSAGGLEALIAPRMAHEALGPMDGDGVALLRVSGRVLCGIVLQGRAVLRRDPGVSIRDDFELIRGWSWSRP